MVKGGRYDDLLSHFGKAAPAIGFVVVIDDLMEALYGQRVKIPLSPSKTVITYTSCDFAEKLTEARQLRGQGKAVELIPERTVDE